MRDDFLTADWARHHDATVTGMNATIRAIAAGWARLNTHQFDAPWRRERNICG